MYLLEENVSSPFHVFLAIGGHGLTQKFLQEPAGNLAGEGN